MGSRCGCLICRGGFGGEEGDFGGGELGGGRGGCVAGALEWMCLLLVVRGDNRRLECE